MHNQEHTCAFFCAQTDPLTEVSVVVVEVEVIVQGIAIEGRPALIGPATDVHPGIDPSSFAVP